MSLQSRLTLIEAARTHRRRLHVAEVLAPMEGISLEQAYERTAIDPTDQVALLERFGRDHVDVGAVTGWLAQRHGLTAEETAEAVAQAERCHALLEDHHGPA